MREGKGVSDVRLRLLSEVVRGPQGRSEEVDRQEVYVDSPRSRVVSRTFYRPRGRGLDTTVDGKTGGEGVWFEEG